GVSSFSTSRSFRRFMETWKWPKFLISRNSGRKTGIHFSRKRKVLVCPTLRPSPPPATFLTPRWQEGCVSLSGREHGERSGAGFFARQYARSVRDFRVRWHIRTVHVRSSLHAACGPALPDHS